MVDPTFINRIIRGKRRIEPSYWWKLDEELSDDVAHCIYEDHDDEWDGEWLGDRTLTEPHHGPRASQLDKDDLTAQIRLPYDYHWFESGNWTISFWVKFNHATYPYATPTNGFYYNGDNTTNIGSEVPILKSVVDTSTNRLSFGNFVHVVSGTAIKHPTRLAIANKVVEDGDDYLDTWANFRQEYRQYNGGWQLMTITSKYDVGDNETTISMSWDGTEYAWNSPRSYGFTLSPNVFSGLIVPFADTSGYLELFGMGKASFQDFRVYTRALTLPQIKDIYTQHLRKEFFDVVNYQNKAVYFPMEENSSPLEDVLEQSSLTGPLLSGGLPAPAQLTLHGSPTLGVNDSPFTQFPGSYGTQCIQLSSATSDYLEQNDFGMNFQGGDGQVGMWVKLDNLNTYQPLWNFGGHGKIYFDPSGNLTLANGGPGGGGSSGIDSVTIANADLPESVTNLEWFYAHVVFDGTVGNYLRNSANLFINNKLIATIDYTSGGFSTTKFRDAPMQIGKFSTLYLDGKVCHYTAISAPLVQFDQPSSGTAFDPYRFQDRWNKIWEKYVDYR